MKAALSVSAGFFYSLTEMSTASLAVAGAWFMIKNNTAHPISLFTPQPEQPHAVTVSPLSQRDFFHEVAQHVMFLSFFIYKNSTNKLPLTCPKTQL